MQNENWERDKNFLVRLEIIVNPRKIDKINLLYNK